MIISCQSPQTTDTEKAKPIKEIKRYTIEQFLDNASIYARSFSHDEQRILVGNNSSGIYNAGQIDLATGELTALTNSTDESVWAQSFLPNDDRFLFVQDKGGDEIDHIYLREADGTSRELTPDEGAKAGFYGWADDKKTFFYGFNKRDERYMDVYEMDTENFESIILYKNEEGLDFSDISNDKRYIALEKTINRNDNDLMLFDRDSKEMIKVNQTLSANSASGFSVDNASFYYLTDEGSEFQYLMRYDIASGEQEKVLEEAWDISYAYLSKTGKYRVVGINKDGKTQVKLFNAVSGAELDFPALPQGDVSSVRIADSEEQMIITAGSSQSSADLFLYNFKTKAVKQLTKTMSEEVDIDNLVAAEIVRYPSFDGLEIPAIYYKPKSATAENKVPAIVFVHGGPGGQSRANFSALIQYLVNHDYAVLAVNNRGSSGYGKTFFGLDDQNHGENDLQDCIEGKNYLASLPYVDKDNIAIVGGSYGGFMVMRAMTHTPEEFKVGVNLFGVTNWLRTLKNIPPWWESFREALYLEMGDPNTEDSLRLYDISPVFHGDKVKHPVMVLQGATDPRVLQVESDEMVAAIKKNGVPVEYVLFDDEGHGFVKKENQIEGYGKMLEFLDSYLKVEKAQVMK
ncbi:MAG: dipeptidyl aminopeptidase/acylaminoacyl peptidase [Flavobacteriales bacterium]|jgi:dipeptidyl aminopeptidase/acylaminoacyl peptidase